MTVDGRQPGALQRVMEANPMAVILDATDDRVSQTCPLSVLLSGLPKAENRPAELR